MNGDTHNDIEIQSFESKTQKREYTTPSFTIVEFEVEKGFSASNAQLNMCFSFLLFNNDYDENQVTYYNESDWTW